MFLFHLCEYQLENKAVPFAWSSCIPYFCIGSFSSLLNVYFIWKRYWASPSKWLLTLYRHLLNWKWKKVKKLDESWINFLLICTAKIFYLQHSSLALYIQLMRFQIHVKERHLNCYSVWRHGTGKKKEGFHQMTEELLPDPFRSQNRAWPGNAISDCHQWDCLRLSHF